MSTSLARKTLHSLSLAWKRRIPGMPRPYSEALELDLIEPRIASLVSHMNVAEVVETFACCEGHNRLDGIDFPYVAFEADSFRSCSQPCASKFCTRPWEAAASLDR